MNKIPLIIQREYLTRVKKRSFIVMTILGPVLFGAMFIIPAILHLIDTQKEQRIAIIDHTGLYEKSIENSETLQFNYLPVEMEATLRQDFKNSGYYAFLVIEEDLLKTPGAISLVSDGQVTPDTKNYIESSLREALKEKKLASFNHQGLDTIIDAVNSVSLNIPTLRLESDGTETRTSTEIAMIISMVFAFMLYMLIFVYGSLVLRGVMEEKSNRIVEIIISSVKPFELMLGKIVGIALVALTQFVLWIGLTMLLLTAITPLLGDPAAITPTTGIEVVATPGNMITPAQVTGNQGLNLPWVIEMINTINPVQTLLLFLFYFIGGYLLYAALFAAIGSIVDNETDSQQFMLPITIPIIIALYVAMVTFRNPESALVFWFSIIPLTSPIVMMARIPFDVPFWQLLLSMAMLVAGFLFATWFAARIYRTGILMYGKKVSYKELWKWFRYSGK